MKLNLKRNKSEAQQEQKDTIKDTIDYVLNNLKNGDDLYNFMVQFHIKIYMELDALYFDRLKWLIAEENKKINSQSN